jgi:dTDP-glucose 4,6-dehydratase
MIVKVYQKQYGLPAAWVRATNVYGARQQLFKIVPRSVIYMKLDRKIRLDGGGVAVKSYINVRDVSRAELAVLQSGRNGERYHVSPDAGVAVCDIVRMIAERMGRAFADVTEIGAERPGQDAAYVIDSSKARQEFGWRPQIGIEQGLQETVDWVSRNWAEISRQPLEYRHKA